MIQPVVIGDAVLYHASYEAVLPLLGKGLSVCVDPPYLIRVDGGGRFRAARPYLDDIQNAALHEGFDIDLIDAEVMPSIAVFCHNDQLDTLLPHLKQQYGRYAVCSWLKTNAMPVGNKHYRPDREFWVHAWVDGFHPVGTLEQKSRYWSNANGRQDLYDHPTVKPVDLMRKVVRNVQGETITDIFMGTGSTGAAALIERRKFVGVEKEKRYFDMAVDRIRKVYQQGLAKMPAKVA